MYKFYTDCYYTVPETHAVTIAFVQELVQAVTDKAENGSENIMRETILFAEEHLGAILSREDHKATMVGG